MKLHTFLAIAVLVAAGAWVATGEFSSVGSQAEGASPPATTPAVPESAPPQPVGFAVAQNSDYQRKLQISGVTAADKSSVLAARSAGVIANLPVAKGSTVAEGDLIMALDGPEKYTALEAAEAAFQQQEKATEADQRLLASGQIGRLRADQSQAALVAARSALEAARADLDRLEVKAPFAGIVDDIMVEAGAWVQPGTPIASIIALDPIIAVGEVGEQNLPLVEVGADARVSLANGVDTEGKIRFIRREASDLTRTYPVEVAIDNSDLRIPAGMSAAITLEASPVASVQVPRSVITLGPDGEVGVRIVDADDKAAFLPVTIVDDTAKGLVVTGISDGTRVIVAGQDLVTDGQPVTAIDQTAAAEDWARSE